MKVSFKAARVNAKISQTDAAKYLGVAQSTLQRWENDGSVPVQAVVKMCDLYGCTIDDFDLSPNTNNTEGDEANIE